MCPHGVTPRWDCDACWLEAFTETVRRHGPDAIDRLVEAGEMGAD